MANTEPAVIAPVPAWIPAATDPATIPEVLNPSKIGTAATIATVAPTAANPIPIF